MLQKIIIVLLIIVFPNLGYCSYNGNNNINGGYMYESDNSIYYVGFDKGLYQLKSSGQRIKLSSAMAYYINVIDDVVYFSNFKDGYKLSKLEDNELTTLTNSKASYISVINDLIYYTNEQNYICKIKTDGSSFVQLNNSQSFWLNYYKDYIYYVNRDDSDFIYRLSINDGSIEKINNVSARLINLYNDKVYYIGSRDFKIHCLDLYNGVDNIILKDRVMELNVSDGNLIYLVYDLPKLGLYKFNLDSKEELRLHNGFLQSPIVIGSSIYYTHTKTNPNTNKYETWTYKLSNKNANGDEIVW
jgi:hypothetical protein